MVIQQNPTASGYGECVNSDDKDNSFVATQPKDDSRSENSGGDANVSQDVQDSQGLDSLLNATPASPHGYSNPDQNTVKLQHSCTP